MWLCTFCHVAALAVVLPTPHDYSNTFQGMHGARFIASRRVLREQERFCTLHKHSLQRTLNSIPTGVFPSKLTALRPTSSVLEMLTVSVPVSKQPCGPPVPLAGTLLPHCASALSHPTWCRHALICGSMPQSSHATQQCGRAAAHNTRCQDAVKSCVLWCEAGLID